MAEKVEILVTAKDAASQVLRGITSQFGEIGNAVQSLTSGVGLEYLTSQIINFGKESVNATVAYADEVRRLQQVTGASATETSRLIQLADDYKISTGELMVAQRMLAKDGITLTTDALAKLSDEYLKLGPGAERSAFLLENFGRSGFKMAELLQQGGAAIRQMSADIDENLVLTNDAVIAAREYEIAMDSWEEQTMKLQYALGNELVPALTETLGIVNKTADDLRENKSAWYDFIPTVAMFKAGTTFYKNAFDEIMVTNNEVNDQWVQLEAALQEQGLAMDEATASTYGLKVATEEQIQTAIVHSPIIDSATRSYIAMGKALGLKTQMDLDTEAMQRLSDANLSFMSTLSTVASAETGYQQQIAQIENERTAAQQGLAAARAAGWWEQSEQVQGYLGKLDELNVKEGEITTAYKQAAAERIFAMVQQKLAVDGLTEAETNYLLKVGEGMGLYTEEQVAKTQEAIKQANDLVAGFDKTQQDMKALQEKNRQESLEAFRQYGTGVSEVLENSESAQLDKSQEAWRLYAEGVGTQLDNNIQKVNEYINALTDIPGEISTTVNITPTPAGDTAGGSTLSGGRTIVYNIQNAYIGADNSIMQVV